MREDLDRRLESLDWHEEDQVLRRLHSPRRFSGRAIAVVCVALLLLCSTALAVTLTLSHRAWAVQQAREAVCGEYGLTSEQLDLFSAQVEEVDGGWRVTLQSSALNPEALGVYTVWLQEGETEVTWSHDKETPLPDGDLSSSAWGSAQIQRALSLRSDNLNRWIAAEAADTALLTLEERATLDAPLLEAPQAASLIHVLPRESDVSSQAAQKLAEQAIIRKYGIPAGSLTLSPGNFFLLLHTDTSQRVYDITFTSSDAAYRVRLDAETGVALSCAYYGPADAFRLPQSDLSQYPEAAEEYVQCGAFDLLTPVEQALISQRYAAAGLSTLLPHAVYADPSTVDIREAEAVEKAKAALADTFGMPPEGYGFYTLRISLLAQDSAAAWEIRLIPAQQDDWHWFAAYGERLGAYTVTLDAATGQTLTCDWSLRDVAGTDNATPATFGASAAYTAPMLPWLRTLLERLQSILDRYDPSANLDEMTLADRAAYDQLMRQSGYSPRNHGSTLPEAGELSQDQARQLAEEALVSLYELDQSLLRRYTVQTDCTFVFDLEEEPVKCWCFSFQSDGATDLYSLLINAANGNVEGYWHDAAASGNG